MRIGLLFVLVFGLSLQSAGAQRLDSFPQNPAEYIVTLGNFMTANKQKILEETFKEFSQVYSSGMFTKAEQLKIQEVSNEMLNRRMTPAPFFSVYLNTLPIVKKMESQPGAFLDWHDLVERMLERQDDFKRDDFLQFLRFSEGFYERRTLHYSEAGTSWFVLGGEEQWLFDEEPILELQNIDLVARRSGSDSLRIFQTSGQLFPARNLWKGKAGRVTWERTDLGRDVYADLSTYTLDTKRSIYEANNAKLYYPLYFGSEAVVGDFTDKLVAGGVKGGVSYPRFSSKNTYLDIADVGDGIKLRGGIELEGATVYAMGDGSRKAEVEVRVEDKNKVDKLIGKSSRFVVRREELVVGEGVETTIFFDQDSLYHPSVNMRLIIPERKVMLTRGKRGSDRNPFYHSRNAVNIDAEYMDISLDTDSMVIGKPTLSFSNKADVVFESLDYFDATTYRRFQNIATANPLAIMYATSKQEGTRFIDAEVVAKRINSKFTVDNIQTLIYDLVAQGFVNYDSESQEIELKEKVENYVLASQKKVDYDRLRILSRAKGANAMMNSKTGTVNIFGVSGVEFSTAQRVAAVPDSSQLTLKGDRNLDFDGRVFAGYSVIEGKDFHFEYEPFHIRLDSVDNFNLFVPKMDEYDSDGRPKAYSIASQIEGFSGVLLIDAPGNKSGREQIPLFPSLQSKGTSYVFYERDSTQEGAYGRDSFYFEIEPFSFDHLDAFTEDDLEFEGKLVSGGIFPDIDETLRLQEADKSLGFTTSTPDEGYEAYGDRGNYAGDVTLSNEGLLGKGKLKYLGADVESEDLAFTPNKATASADRFDLEEDRTPDKEVPQVGGEDVKIEWRPYVDSMYVRSEKEAFDIYQSDDHDFEGMLILTPGGLKGNGSLEWSKAGMTSDYVDFGAYSAYADTASVRIRSLETDERLALETSNVRADLDFDEQKGKFKANDDVGSTELPYNEYLTSITEFTWDMEGAFISFKDPRGTLGRFTSLHSDQDSLTFEGEEAFFNLKTSLLEIEGVPYIVSADAFVYPDSGHVEILPHAKMRRLENARIVADTLNKNHVINRATVDITGRRTYKASGFYEYNIGNREQEFELSDIVGAPVGKGKYSDKAVETRAKGQVTASDSFYIDHKTRFQGTINLSAQNKNLYFDGFARLDIDRQPRASWFTISSEGDKQDLAISFKEPKNKEGIPLRTGFFLSRETADAYASIMAPLPFRKDRAILPVTGVFKYDEADDKFLFGDSTKVLFNELKGNMVIYNNSNGKVYGEGRLGIGTALGGVKLDAVGRVYGELVEQSAEAIEEVLEEPEEEAQNLIMLAEEEEEPDTTATNPEEIQRLVQLPPVKVEAMMGINMRIPPQLLKIVANDFKSASFDASAVGYMDDIDFFRRSLVELFPESKERTQALEGMALGYLDLPKKINPYEMVFARMPMKWNPEYQSFVSTENTTGLISLADASINKQAFVRLECRMPSSGDDDRLYLYLKSPSELFYFFGYKQGILSVCSNNTVFMQEIEKMKEKDLIYKLDNGMIFEIQAVELSTASTFLRRVENAAKD